jgi:ATP-dependent helicase/nuclease subunit A
MPRRLRPLAHLEAEQLAASHPRDHAALSASAGTGTGKTPVFARVLRLFPAGVDPASIPCLGVIPAGAAGMAGAIRMPAASPA